MLKNILSGEESICEIPHPKVSASSLAGAELAQETGNFFSHDRASGEPCSEAQNVTCSCPGLWHQGWCVRFVLLQNSL